MKAKELIKFLEQNPEAEVLTSGFDGFDFPYSTQLDSDDIKLFKVGDQCDIDYDKVCTNHKIVHTDVFIIK